MRSRALALAACAAILAFATAELAAQNAAPGAGPGAAPAAGPGAGPGGAAGGGFGRGGRGGRGGGGPPPGPAPRDASGRVILDGTTSTTVGVWTPNFGISDPVAPYETVPFQPWAKALYDSRQVHELEPHARCKASGASRQFLTPYGVEFVEIPELKRLYIFDIGGPHTFRTVYLDGRPHPEDLQPSNYGHSIGRWEGDTLVIDTVGYNEDFWFERRGLPHTEALRTVERFTRDNERQITYTIEVHDPNVYTAPFTGGFTMNFQAGTELFEYVCQQANYAHELMVGGAQDSVDRSSTIVP